MEIRGAVDFSASQPGPVVLQIAPVSRNGQDESLGRRRRIGGVGARPAKKYV